jgi:hypothetical protein
MEGNKMRFEVVYGKTYKDMLYSRGSLFVTYEEFLSLCQHGVVVIVDTDENHDAFETAKKEYTKEGR